jgi:ABC-2 type transport system permease protein
MLKQLLGSPVIAIIRAEILFNRRRAAPYVLLVLFSANAVLWWQGASVAYGWATNSDFYIARLFGGFAFLTTPFFVAMLTGDAVSRDFRFEITALLLSKPIHRAEYVLGKFFGNFIVLTTCGSIYALTLFLLQTVRLDGMIVLPLRITPYVKHFFILVVITQFALAAFCFLVGTLTRNSKLVYLFVTALYAVYIPTMVFFQFYSPRSGKLFDPFLFDWVNANGRNRPAELLNQMVITYDWQLITNRLIVLTVAAICLLIAYWRFTYAEDSRASDKQAPDTGLLGLVEKSDRLYHEETPAEAFPVTGISIRLSENLAERKPVQLPQVAISHKGFGGQLRRLLAATAVEFRLLGGERSLVMLIPLTVLMCVAQLAPLVREPGTSALPLSALYAANSTDVLLLLLFGVSIFFTGEAVFRDRELRLEAILWCAPVADAVFLLAKFLAVFLLACGFVMLGALTAIGLQSYRNFATLDLYAYLKVYSIILLPAVVFMIGASLLLSVLLREKYVAYIAGVASGGGLFYLFTQGHKGWLYNPVLFQLWEYTDLSGTGRNFARILLQRLYWLAIAIACLAAAQLFFRRGAVKSIIAHHRLSEKGWALTIALAAALLAVVAGLKIAFGNWS